MSSTRYKKVGSPRRGASTLELAMTLPVFLTLSFGIIEFGRGFMVQQFLTNGAREGARYASLPNSTSADVVAKTREFLSKGSIDPAKVAITVTPTDLSSAKSGTQVKVHVRVAYSDVTWMPVPTFIAGKDLTSETAMRHE